MSEQKDNRTRQERLAAKLRENLRRRKAQSREMCSRALDTDKPTLPKKDRNS